VSERTAEHEAAPSSAREIGQDEQGPLWLTEPLGLVSLQRAAGNAGMATLGASPPATPPGETEWPRLRPLLSPSRVLALQRAVGNQSVVRMLSRAPPKGPPEPRIYVPDRSVESLPEGTHSVVRSPPGSKDVRLPTEVGAWSHRYYEKFRTRLLRNAEKLTSDTLPDKLEKEYRIPDTRVPWRRRPVIDRLNRAAGEVIEIKPAHLKAVGEAEAKAYAALMDKVEPLPNGRRWSARCVTYDQAKVIRYLRGIGVLKPEAKTTAEQKKPRPKKAAAKPKATVPKAVKAVPPTVRKRAPAPKPGEQVELELGPRTAPKPGKQVVPPAPVKPSQTPLKPPPQQLELPFGRRPVSPQPRVGPRGGGGIRGRIAGGVQFGLDILSIALMSHIYAEIAAIEQGKFDAAGREVDKRTAALADEARRRQASQGGKTMWVNARLVATYFEFEDTKPGEESEITSLSTVEVEAVAFGAEYLEGYHEGKRTLYATNHWNAHMYKRVDTIDLSLIYPYDPTLMTRDEIARRIAVNERDAANRALPLAIVGALFFERGLLMAAREDALSWLFEEVEEPPAVGP
jgi:hypothetical protein